MVQEHRGEYPFLWSAIESISAKIGCVPQTLNEWVKKREIDYGAREGVASEERERIKALERENKELRRANEILKLASAFFDLAGSTANSSPDRIRHSASRCLRGRSDLQSAANCPAWLPSPCRRATHTSFIP
jgi:transposase